jgi:hypothetical protein
LFAIVLAAYRLIWITADSNEYSPWSDNAVFLFSTYLATVSTATAITFFGKDAARRFAVGYAFFGWPYLVFVLHGSFIPEGYLPSWLLARNSMVGVALGVLCGLACHRLASARS